MKIVLLCGSYFALLPFLSTILVRGDDSLLRFLILADWGKGGSTGSYGSVVQSPRNEGGLHIEGDPNGGNGEGGGNAGKGGDGGGQKGGDGGGKGGKGKKNSNQLAVAKSMNQFASSADPPPEFILALGDNFYDNGVQSATDELWDYLWKNVYIDPYPSLNIPWYASPGNHDYQGSVQAQIDRYYQHNDDDLWIMPATNFTKVFEAKTTDGTTVRVAIVFIDTATLAPQSNKCCNENSGISKDEQSRRIIDQLLHLKADFDELKKNPPDWTIAVGHYPIYSAGDHCDNSELISYLLPLLQAYHVDAYIAGHDHISEHLQYQGIEYFIAGAGALTDSLNSKCTSEADLKWYGVGYSAFAYADATKSNLTITYIDTNDDVKYSYSVYKNLISPTASPTKLRTRSRSPTTLPINAPPKDHESDSGGSSNTFFSNLPSAKTASISVAAVVVAAALFFVFYRFYHRKDSKEKQDKAGNTKKPIASPTHRRTSPSTTSSPPRTPMKMSVSPSSSASSEQKKRIARNYMKFTNSPSNPDSYDSDEHFEDDEEGNVSPSRAKKSPVSPGKPKSLYEMVEKSDKNIRAVPVASTILKKPKSKKRDGKYAPLNDSEKETITPYSPALTGAADDNHGGHLFKSIHTPGNQPVLHRRAYTASV